MRYVADAYQFRTATLQKRGPSFYELSSRRDDIMIIARLLNGATSRRIAAQINFLLSHRVADLFVKTGRFGR